MIHAGTILASSRFQTVVVYKTEGIDCEWEIDKGNLHSMQNAKGILDHGKYW